MMLSRISSLTASQAVRGQMESNSSQADNSTSAGWKYVTVTEGDTVYTYIVIGKNMKILIGKSSAKEDDKDEKSAGGKNEATATADKPTAGIQTAASKQSAQQVHFLNDYRMLGLTGYYQKKMRETMEDMENQLGCNKVDTITTSPITKHTTEDQ